LKRAFHACAVRPRFRPCASGCVCVGGGGSVDFYAPPLEVVSRFLFITGKLEQNAAVSQFLFGEISKAKAPKLCVVGGFCLRRHRALVLPWRGAAAVPLLNKL